MAASPVSLHQSNRALFGALAVSTAALLWAFWTTLTEIANRWSQDPQYSHGYLVPVFAAGLLWFRRDRLREAQPSWWGLVLLAFGVGTRLVGAYFSYLWLDEIALVPCVAGLVLL